MKAIKAGTVTIGPAMPEKRLRELMKDARSQRAYQAVMGMLDLSIMDAFARAEDPTISDKETFMLIGESKALKALKLQLVALEKQAEGDEGDATNPA